MDVSLKSLIVRGEREGVWDQDAEDNLDLGGRKWREAEVCLMYPSPNIIREIKWRRMRLDEHVARMGEIIN
jgi:hypothetical protein